MTGPERINQRKDELMAKSELAARLQSEVVAAMKAKNKERLGVLRMLQAAVKQVEVDERRELTDADVIRILASYARRVKDQLAGAQDSGRAVAPLCAADDAVVLDSTRLSPDAVVDAVLDLAAARGARRRA